MAEKYSTKKLLGEGSYGKCYLIQEKSTHKQYVGKAINTAKLTRQQVDTVLKEGKMMEKLNHPFIVGFKEVLKSKTKILIVMEYAEGGDLQKYQNSFGTTLIQEAEVKRLMVQICLALKYLHERNIIHRDLKPENVFLAKNRDVKLGDFGVSKELRSARDLTNTIIGTPYYLSPEIIRNEAYGCQTDIWSLGVMIYELCSKRHPFEARNIVQLYEAIKRAEVPALPRGYSRELEELLKRMLDKTPSRRPTVKDLLHHPVLKGELSKQLSQGLELNVSLKAETIRRIQQPKVTVVLTPSNAAPRPSPEAQIFGRDPEPLPLAVVMQDYSQREPERQAVIRALEAKKQEIGREPPPLACIDEHEEFEKDYKENQQKMLEAELAMVEGPGDVRRVEMEQGDVRAVQEYQDLQPPVEIIPELSIPSEPRPSPLPQIIVPRLGQGPDPSVLRHNLTSRLGADRFQAVYIIVRQLSRHPLFSDIGTSSYRAHLQHLLNVHLQIVCVPQVKLLLRLEGS